MTFPILQFGTSRFLQAHFDLFVDQGFSEGLGKGQIAVVQTTHSRESAKRLDFFNSGKPYVVKIQGLSGETEINEEVPVASIGRGVDANSDWPEVERLFAEEARWVISNTGDRGYELFAGDEPSTAIPRSFPAKLAKLLRARFRAGAKPLTFFPCELIEGNGEKLCALVLEISRAWSLSEEFQRYAGEQCLWVNSLVDRIVSEPLEPAGAVAEPYALWAVENRAGLVMPCVHKDVVVTDDLKRYERLKLFLLNLSHTYMAERWRQAGAPEQMLTREWLENAAWRADLEDLVEREVQPVFDALGLGDAAREYRVNVITRFKNPFLFHYLADVYRNREAKKLLRFGGVIALARQGGLDLAQQRLPGMLGE
jgi:tagaturonate reductase